MLLLQRLESFGCLGFGRVKVRGEGAVFVRPQDVPADDAHTVAGEDFEALEAAVAQLVLWQHSRDGMADDLVLFGYDSENTGRSRAESRSGRRETVGSETEQTLRGRSTYLFRTLLLHDLVRRLLQSSWEHCVLAVHKLLLLPSRHLDILRVRHNHIVSAVHWKRDAGSNFGH